MIKTRRVYRIFYAKASETPTYVVATSFRSAAAIAVSISDEEIMSITKLDIEVNVKFD